jgi:predicted AlkP superfamily phosphohydrolase/phosphomutase
VTIIGLDGATLDLIEPWATSGHLPAFRRILRNGAVGRLRSTIPPLTAPAWTSFLTGQNPGKHGIFDAVVRQPGSYAVRIASARDKRGPSLWAHLGRQGLRIAAVNVPVTYPPEAVNGILIADVGALAVAHFMSPSALYPAFRRAVPDYVVNTVVNSLDAIAEGCKRMMDAHHRAFDYVRTRERWDVQMLVFSATDMAQHVFWQAMADGDSRYGDVILDTYRSADALIAQLLDELAEDDLLLVLSDHGGGHLRRVVYVNRALHQAGFLYPSPQQSGHRFMTLSRALKRRLPPQTRAWLRGFGGLRDRLASTWAETLCDWQRTRICSVGACGHLYVNLRGREPQGQVGPGIEYKYLLRDVTDYMLSLRDPQDGRSVVEAVWRREEIYDGPALDDAPDLILQWRDSAYETRPDLGPVAAPVFEDTVSLAGADGVRLTGCHRPNGLLMAYGAGVRPGHLGDASILDLAPTILAALGLDVPAGMDGRVLDGLLPGQSPLNAARLPLAGSAGGQRR